MRVQAYNNRATATGRGDAYIIRFVGDSRAELGGRTEAAFPRVSPLSSISIYARGARCAVSAVSKQ